VEGKASFAFHPLNPTQNQRGLGVSEAAKSKNLLFAGLSWGGRQSKLRLPPVKTQRKTSAVWGLRCLYPKKGQAPLALFCYINRQKVGSYFLPHPLLP
jgi:hypothetical protein